MRAKTGTLNTATAMITLLRPGPSIATTAIASSMPGKAKSTSEPRIISISTQRP